MASEQQWREAVLAIADEYAAAAQWRETPEPGDGHVAHTVRVIESDLRRVIESDLRAMVARLDFPDAATLRERLLAACGDKERLAAINASRPKFTTREIRDLIAEHGRVVNAEPIEGALTECRSCGEKLSCVICGADAHTGGTGRG